LVSDGSPLRNTRELWFLRRFLSQDTPRARQRYRTPVWSRAFIVTTIRLSAKYEFLGRVACQHSYRCSVSSSTFCVVIILKYRHDWELCGSCTLFLGATAYYARLCPSTA
jgi:hypothetical protein